MYMYNINTSMITSKMLLTTGPIFFIMEPKFKLSQSFVNHIRTKHIKQNQTPSPLLNKITPVGFF